MRYVSEEEISLAQQLSAIEYLRKYEPGRLKKSSARNEWELIDHDSFKINEITSKWHWKSRGIGGVTALKFLTRVDGMDFIEAVQMLCNEHPSYVPFEPPKQERKPFTLPKAHTDIVRVRRYLNQRGISDGVIRYCVSLGILYESVPYHNAVFVGVDEQEVPRYAFLRGTHEASAHAFKMEAAGSDKAHAFCVPPLGRSCRVAVYEACIDALAHMTLEGGKQNKYRLALGGISAPKEGEYHRETKCPQALAGFLKKHPEIREIEICTDNDFAGRWACSHIKRFYEGKYTIIENLPQIEGADYGDMAKQKNVCKHAERGR